MRDPVVLSSELLKKEGCAKFYRAVLSCKEAGTVWGAVVLSSELIEKGGFYAELYCARY